MSKPVFKSLQDHAREFGQAWVAPARNDVERDISRLVAFFGYVHKYDVILCGNCGQKHYRCEQNAHGIGKCNG